MYDVDKWNTLHVWDHVIVMIGRQEGVPDDGYIHWCRDMAKTLFKHWMDCIGRPLPNHPKIDKDSDL